MSLAGESLLLQKVKKSSAVRFWAPNSNSWAESLYSNSHGSLGFLKKDLCNFTKNVLATFGKVSHLIHLYPSMITSLCHRLLLLCSVTALAMK